MTTFVEHPAKVYLYRELPEIFAATSPERRLRASRLGSFQAFFTALTAQLSDLRSHTAA